MAELRPFRALCARPDLAARVASPPYDVMSTEEARALAAGNPDCFLHVSRPEIDLPPGTDEHDDAVYAQARRGLEALRDRGVLALDEGPSLWVYRLTWEGRSQTGVVGAFSLDEYDRGDIVRHEHTRPDKEADRTRHVLTLSAHTGPVFLVHRPAEAVTRAVARATASAPVYDFVAADGVGHTVWRVGDAGSSELVAAFGAVPRLYIADGHHRAAAASNARAALRASGTIEEEDPAHRFLAAAFPTDQVRVLAYNRLVADLGGRGPGAFLEALAATGPLDGPLSGPGAAAPERAGEVRVLVRGQGWRRLWLAPAADDPVSRLDVQALQDRVLRPLLGVVDPRTDQRLRFVGGIRGTGALEEAVARGDAAVAFSLRPVSCEQLLAVADAGQTMPPKSTWFEPKLRSGLLVHMIT